MLQHRLLAPPPGPTAQHSRSWVSNMFPDDAEAAGLGDHTFRTTEPPSSKPRAVPPPFVLSSQRPQRQTTLPRSSSPGGWPEFLLHSQVDFEALDRPLLLWPVTLGWGSVEGKGTLVSPSGPWGTSSEWVPPPSLPQPPLHPSTGNLLQEAFLAKPSLFIIQLPQASRPVAASDSQPSVPEAAVPGRHVPWGRAEQRVLVPPCKLDTDL